MKHRRILSRPTADRSSRRRKRFRRNCPDQLALGRSSARPWFTGPGNQANFGLLLKLVKTGLPLPLASVRNRRSFIYVENLIDLIATCVGNPKAFGKTYLPSDGVDLSTQELIRAIARANTGVEQAACLPARSAYRSERSRERGAGSGERTGGSVFRWRQTAWA